MAKHSGYLLSNLDRIIPWVILLILLFFTYGFFMRLPYAGFQYSRTGQIDELYFEDSANNSLRKGDQLLQIGATLWSDFETNAREVLFDDVSPGEIVSLNIQRDAQELVIAWTFPGPTLNEVVQRLNSQWWLSYVFWLVGTATILLIRPQDTRWKLLVAFNYLTAIWLIAGGTARQHIWESVFVLKSAVWLSVPVYLHLHWLFPQPLGRLPTFVIWSGYLIAIVLAILEWLQVLQNDSYRVGFLLAILGSLMLLAVRIFSPAQRQELRPLIAAVLLAFTPALGITIVQVLGVPLPAFIEGGSTLALSAIPSAYLYIVYQHQRGPLEPQVKRLIHLYLLCVLLGTLIILAFVFASNWLSLSGSQVFVSITAIVLTALIAIIGFAPLLSLVALADAYSTGYRSTNWLELRTNQLITPFLFIVLLGTIAAILAAVAELQFNFAGATLLSVFISAVLVGASTTLGYRSFQRFVERHVLGIPLPSVHLIDSYAARITRSLDRTSLVLLLTKEILPSLLVRQSVLLYFEAGLTSENVPTVIYAFGAETKDIPAVIELPVLLEQEGRYRPPQLTGNELQVYSWVRLALTLQLGSQVIGIWLLGRRDPDDLYSQTEISILKTLADQTAVALSHILLAENLQALYQANIDRHEAERINLARELHDAVLNQAMVLSMYLDRDATTPQFHAAYQGLTTHLRQIIGDLRPAMLIYGLQPALEELVDNLNERMGGGVSLKLILQPVSIRYELNVEEHLYRITQQATENAIKHAHAQNVYISGQLDETEITLSITDNGKGFILEEPLNLGSLVAHKHFGIAGMYERAALIGAQLTINSNPGEGTVVAITWQAN